MTHGTEETPGTSFWQTSTRFRQHAASDKSSSVNFVILSRHPFKCAPPHVQTSQPTFAYVCEAVLLKELGTLQTALLHQHEAQHPQVWPPATHPPRHHSKQTFTVSQSSSAASRCHCAVRPADSCCLSRAPRRDPGPTTIIGPRPSTTLSSTFTLALPLSGYKDLLPIIWGGRKNHKL